MLNLHHTRRATDRDAMQLRREFWQLKEAQALEGAAFLAAQDRANIDSWLARYNAARAKLAA